MFPVVNVPGPSHVLGTWRSPGTRIRTVVKNAAAWPRDFLCLRWAAGGRGCLYTVRGGAELAYGTGVSEVSSRSYVRRIARPNVRSVGKEM